MDEKQQNRLQLLQFIKESFTYSLTKIIPGILGFFSVIIFLRLLGPEEYGLYSMLFLLVQISSFFCFGWFRQALLRYYSRLSSNTDLSSIMSSALLITISLNILFLAVFYFVQFPIPFPFVSIILLAISISLFTLSAIIYMAQEKPAKVVQLTVLQSILAIALPFAFIHFVSPTHIQLINGLVLAYGITALIFLYQQLRHHQPVLHWVWPRFASLKQLQPLLQFGWPLSFWYAGSTGLRFLDRFFIEHYLDSAVMGSYAGFTEMITRFFTVLLFPVTLALHPRIMNLWNEKKYSNAIHLLKTGLITQSGLFLIVLLIYVVFKDQWLLLLFAVFPDLDSALINIIIPIMFGGFLWQFALLVHKPLEVREKSKLMLIFIFLSIAVNIIGNMVFLPKVGVIATAYTMVVSGGVYLLFTMLASSRFWMVRFGK